LGFKLDSNVSSENLWIGFSNKPGFGVIFWNSPNGIVAQIKMNRNLAGSFVV
jgi:hypothetical protein